MIQTETLREIREKYTWNSAAIEALSMAEKALRVYENPDTISRGDAIEMFDRTKDYTGDEVRVMLKNMQSVKESLE